jgi:hypothetical protein
MMFKIRTESSSYTATTIVKRDGLFRTVGTGRPPGQIAAILQDLEYPMPMAEDFSGETLSISHEKIQDNSAVCIEKHPTTVRSSVSFPTFCLDAKTNALLEIYSPKTRRSTIRNELGDFQGRSVAFSVRTTIGDSNVSFAEVTDLSEAAITEGMLTASEDMERVKDANIARRIR